MTWGRFLKSKSGRQGGFSASRRGLITQLFLVTVLPLTLLVVAFTFGSLVLHQRAMRSLVGERDQLAVKTAASSIAEQVRQRVNAIRLLSVNAQGVSAEGLDGLLATTDFLEPDFDHGLAFFEPDGGLETLTGDRSFWESMTADLAPSLLSFSKSNQPNYLILDSLEHPRTGERLVFILAAEPDRRRISVGAFSAAALARHTFGDTSDSH